MTWRVETGDCREHRPEQPHDAIVTDPPYGYGIKGNAWDTGVAFDPATWEALAGTVKEGGYVVAFTATAHVEFQLTLSEHAQKFLVAALDLLVTVEEADEVLVTDEIRKAATRLRAVIRSGDL